MNLTLIKKIVFVCFAILTTACSSGSLVNLTDSKNSIRKYYEDGQYINEMNSIVEDVINKYNNVEFKPNDAVVFDVDETVLSNFDYIKSIDYGYDLNLWNNWLDKAEAEKIIPAKKLYDFFVFKGAKVIFLTGRYWYSCDATYKNLVNQGFDQFDTLICRSEEELKISSPQFKANHRKNLSLNGYNIIACIGDQETDFVGGYTGEIIKFPNYIYKID